MVQYVLNISTMMHDGSLSFEPCNLKKYFHFSLYESLLNTVGLKPKHNQYQ